MDQYVHSACATPLHFYEHTDTIVPAAARPGVSVPDFAGADEAMAWFTAERPVLLAALPAAAGRGLDRHVCHLARALFVFLHPLGRWHDRVEAQRAAVAAARGLNDPAEESHAHRNLAFALADLGRFDEAHANLDAALARSQDNLAGQAWTHYHRDIVYAIQGRERAALAAARTTGQEHWRRAHAVLDGLDPSATDQIHTQLTIIDAALADAFRRSSSLCPPPAGGPG
jgi:tetratricopeptide (TPR) repeat protein